ncbi:MAG: hypothetical protein LQ337_008935 [Flavoplaca oasis]|nr:MAG: hypothetical protein LQ337_008935 [Flavoplaca oasis]
MSRSAFSPDRDDNVDRGNIMGWLEGTQVQPESPAKPPSVSASITGSKNGYRGPRTPKPASPQLPPQDNNREGSYQRPSAQEFRRRILDDAKKWNIVHARHLPTQICFVGSFDSASDSDTFEKIRSAYEMKREWIRREYFVLSRTFISPVPMRYFGKPKWYALDLLRCFTNMNGHRRGRGEVNWPEGYMPRYLEEARAWDETKDYSVVSESVANDDETESMKSEMAGSNQ